MAEEWLKIRNWDKWQSYRKDRGQPPWIKVHRQLAQNIDWVSLTDAQRGQLVAIWILAGCRNGVIPASPAAIKKLCFMDSEPDLQLFIDKGFIEHGVNVASPRRQDDANMTPQSREEESREETEKTPPTPPPPTPPETEGRKTNPLLTIEDLTFPPSLDNPQSREAFSEWLNYKKKRREGYRMANYVNKLLADFARDGPEGLRAAVNFSTSQNYQGLIRPKAQNGTQGAEQRQLSELDKAIHRAEQEERHTQSPGPPLRGLPERPGG